MKDGFSKTSASFFLTANSQMPAVLQPLEIQGCVVPQWKALISDSLELTKKGRDSNFKVCYPLRNDPYFAS